MRWRPVLIPLLLPLSLSAAPALAASPPAPAPPGSAALTLHGPTSVRAGHPATLAGTLTGAPPGTVVRLYRTHPYGAITLVRSAPVAPDGSFRFSVFPDRTTTYEAAAVLTPAPTPATVTVGVFAAPRVRARALPLGRAQISLAIVHPADLRWNGAPVRWRFITPHGRTIAVLAHPYAPAQPAASRSCEWRWRFRRGRFAGRPASTPRRITPCSTPERRVDAAVAVIRASCDYLRGIPDAGLVGRAIGFLRGRAGRTGMAVIDSEGRMSGWHEHWRFVSASVVKAMLLVAYLRRLHRLGLHQRRFGELVPVPDDPRLRQLRRHADVVDRR